MLSPNLPPRAAPGGASASQTAHGSYIDWAAILAGGVFALAISFLLISFGASVGLSLASPYRGDGVSAAWLAIAAGIWFAWVMVTGFGAGGYLCGRMRRPAGDAVADEVAARDGAHGLVVWATGALVGVVLAASGIGGFVSVGASAAGTVTEAASDAVSSDYFANLMLRSGGMASDEGTGSTDEATAPGVDPAAQQEVAAIIARSVARGEMSEADSSYLARLVSANSNLDQTAARARVDAVNADIDAANTAAVEAAEQARVAGVVLGFIATATLLLGAVAAFFAAAAGGRHRDDGLGFDIFTARR